MGQCDEAKSRTTWIFRHFEIARNLKSASIQAMLSNVLCNLVTAMPIISSITTTPISQQAFGALAFDVMRHVFAIHDEYGRFFDEIVYKRELARRMTGLEIEVGVDVVHQTFFKRYFADVIPGGSGLFEFKTADSVHARHGADHALSNAVWSASRQSHQYASRIGRA